MTDGRWIRPEAEQAYLKLKLLRNDVLCKQKARCALKESRSTPNVTECPKSLKQTLQADRELQSELETIESEIARLHRSFFRPVHVLASSNDKE